MVFCEFSLGNDLFARRLLKRSSGFELNYAKIYLLETFKAAQEQGAANAAKRAESAKQFQEKQQDAVKRQKELEERREQTKRRNEQNQNNTSPLGF